MRRLGQFSNIGCAVFVIFVLAGGLAAALTKHSLFGVAGVLIGVYFLYAIKVVSQWERVAVLRFGRYKGLRGPGLFLIFPVIDTLSRYVDQRIRLATVNAESTLTRDTVPVDVDAIVSGWCGTRRNRFLRSRISCRRLP